MPVRLTSLERPIQQLTNPEQLLKLWFTLPAIERNTQFIDSKTAAELSAVSQRTIRKWIECGSVCALHVGKKYRIHKNSLKEFIAFTSVQNQ
jgi:excisionase family DNA binding protein